MTLVIPAQAGIPPRRCRGERTCGPFAAWLTTVMKRLTPLPTADCNPGFTGFPPGREMRIEGQFVPDQFAGCAVALGVALGVAVGVASGLGWSTL